MPTEPTARKIAKIGLVLEMEDGGKIMVYADDLHDAQVTVHTEAPEWSSAWRSDMVRRVIGPPRTSILIEGLESYRIAETMPAMADHVLEALDAGLPAGHQDLPPARRLEP